MTEGMANRWWRNTTENGCVVPSPLSERINRVAQEQGLSAAALIEDLLDDYERRRRMELFGQAFRSAEAEYWDEFASWHLAVGALADESLTEDV